MKRYILLGIGIGIIFTNIVLSFVHGNKVDIDKLVEAEVQKRLKNIETYQKVEASFKEVVEEPKKETTENIQTSEAAIEVTSSALLEETEKDVQKKYFPGDRGKAAVNYIFVYHSTSEKTLIKIQKDLSQLLDTKIAFKGEKAYLFSKSPYNPKNAKEILNIIRDYYNLKVKITTIQDIKRLLNPPVTKETIKLEEVKKSTEKTKVNEEIKSDVNGATVKEVTTKKAESELVQKSEEIKESVQ